MDSSDPCDVGGHASDAALDPATPGVTPCGPLSRLEAALAARDAAAARRSHPPPDTGVGHGAGAPAAATPPRDGPAGRGEDEASDRCGRGPGHTDHHGTAGAVRPAPAPNAAASAALPSDAKWQGRPLPAREPQAWCARWLPRLDVAADDWAGRSGVADPRVLSDERHHWWWVQLGVLISNCNCLESDVGRLVDPLTSWFRRLHLAAEPERLRNWVRSSLDSSFRKAWTTQALKTGWPIWVFRVQLRERRGTAEPVDAGRQLLYEEELAALGQKLTNVLLPSGRRGRILANDYFLAEADEATRASHARRNRSPGPARPRRKPREGDVPFVDPRNPAFLRDRASYAARFRAQTGGRRLNRWKLNLLNQVLGELGLFHVVRVPGRGTVHTSNKYFFGRQPFELPDGSTEGLAWTAPSERNGG